MYRCRNPRQIFATSTATRLPRLRQLSVSLFFDFSGFPFNAAETKFSRHGLHHQSASPSSHKTNSPCAAQHMLLLRWCALLHLHRTKHLRHCYAPEVDHSKDNKRPLIEHFPKRQASSSFLCLPASAASKLIDVRDPKLAQGAPQSSYYPTH